MDARLSGADQSLDAPLVADDGSAVDRIHALADSAPRPDEMVEMAIDSARRVDWVNSAMTSLTTREKWIVRERRLRDEQVTLESLGERLGISKERVRQIEGRAMEKLRRVLLDRHGDVAALV